MNPHDNTRQALALAYLAGIVDGEGCIRIGLQNKEGQAYNYRPSVSVGMVEDVVINLLKETFGGYIYVEPSVQGKRPIHRWHLVKAPQVEACLLQIRPYLLIKQQQADLVLSLVQNYPKARKMSDLELQRRKELYLEVKKLNAVGAAATTNRENIREDEVIV